MVADPSDINDPVTDQQDLDPRLRGREDWNGATLIRNRSFKYISGNHQSIEKFLNQRCTQKKD